MERRAFIDEAAERGQWGQAHAVVFLSRTISYSRAMRYDPSLLDQIRTRLPISQVVGRRVTFDKRKSQPARGDFWACCPFHKEKTSSFHCDDRRGIYHCFGCGATGDHFKFVCETEGLTFPEAVERLAEEAGVDLPKPDPREREREVVRVGLVGAIEIAAKYFEQQLRLPVGKPAREYMIRRGLEEKTSIEFRFGYAPDERDGLKRHLLQNGVSEATAVEAGLLIRPDNGRSTYDRFRGRLMIPIQDDRGKVVAFGGRIISPEGEPKYLNSPETPIFHKGTMLFNVHRAREAAHKSGTMIVTEGYLDAISVWQSGIRNVVAALGTAFTEDHIARLWRFAAEPVICFDGDKAGIAAAHRAVDRILPLLKSGHSFNFCFLPDGQDPDDIVRKSGSVGFLAAVAAAIPLIDVLWDREVSGARLDTPERKAAIEARFKELIQTIADPVVQRRYHEEIRIRLASLFWRSDARARAKTVDRTEALLAADVKQRTGGIVGVQRLILGLCVFNPLIFELNVDRLMRLSMPAHYQVFLRELGRIVDEFASVDTSVFYRELNGAFYDVLVEVYAGSVEAIERDDIRGQRLREMLPLLRYHPPEVFIEEMFDVFVERLSLKALSDDIETELKLVGADAEESHVAYVTELMREHQRRQEELIRRDTELAETAKTIRAATTGKVTSEPVVAV